MRIIGVHKPLAQDSLSCFYLFLHGREQFVRWLSASWFILLAYVNPYPPSYNHTELISCRNFRMSAEHFNWKLETWGMCANRLLGLWRGKIHANKSIDKIQQLLQGWKLSNWMLLSDEVLGLKTPTFRCILFYAGFIGIFIRAISKWIFLQI